MIHFVTLLLTLAFPSATPGAGQGPIRIMPIGDSITETNTGHASWRYWFYKSLLNDGYAIDLVGSQHGVFGGPPLYSDFDADHEAHSAWQTATMAASIASFTTSSDPEVAILHMGNTDLVQGVPVSFALLGITQILDQLRSVRPNTSIFLAQVVPIESGGLTLTTIPYLNAALPELVALYDRPESRVFLVDHYTDYTPAVDSYDGFHPSASGEQKIAARWLPKLTPVLDTLRPPQLALGDVLTATPASDDDVLSFTFDAVEGQGLALSTKPNSSTPKKVSLDLIAPDGSIEETVSVHPKKLESHSFVLEASGRYALRLRDFTGTIGPVALKTAGKLPKSARSRDVNCVADSAGSASVKLRALPNTSLEVAVHSSVPGDVTFSLETPDGATLDITDRFTPQAKGGALGPLPLVLPGRYEIVIAGLASQKKLSLSVTLQPAD